MNIEQERELFEAGEYSVLAYEISSTHTLVEKGTGRLVAVFYNDYDLESCVEQMQARAKVPSWISVDGYKNIPVGKWLVYMPDALHSIQSAHIHKNISTIGGHFAFDQEKVTKYRPLPPMNGE